MTEHAESVTEIASQAFADCSSLARFLIPSKLEKAEKTTLKDLIRALGADAVVYARRNECCGGYISVESPDSAKRNSNAIIENAKAAGAEMIITACPLCKYNLVKNGADIPVVYFTELLAEALGVKEDTNA